MLDCEKGSGSGDSDVFNGLALGRTPNETLQHLLNHEQYLLPLDGYVRASLSDEIVAFVYQVDGLAKAAVVVANESRLEWSPSRPWVATSAGTCDFSEFGAEVALGPHIIVWRNVERDRIGIETAGPTHCDLQSVHLLRFDWDHPPFVSDPEGKLAEQLAASPYLGDTDLPTGAVDLGYRRDGDELWRVPGDGAMYVVTPDATQRWPKDPGTWGCA